MAKNHSFHKNKKSQSSKPYDAQNRLQRWTSQFTEYLSTSFSRSWRSSTSSATDGLPTTRSNLNWNPVVSNARDALEVDDSSDERYQDQQDEADEEVPAIKRPRTHASSGDRNFSESNVSIPSIRNDTAGPSGISQIHDDQQPGPSGLQHNRGGPVASTPLLHTLPDRTRNAQGNTDINGDDLSDSSESTSGCSSLVPQAGRHEGSQQREVQSKEQAKGGGRLSLSRTSSLVQDRSLFAQPGNLTLMPQTPGTSKRRPSFDVSTLNIQRGSQRNSILDMMVSPFYCGQTTYGGASASRRGSDLSLNMNASLDGTRSPKTPIRRGLDVSFPELTNPRRIQISPVRSPTSSKAGELSGVSLTAKRIMETMETMSSPVNDALRIPLRVDSPLKRKRVDDNLYDFSGSPRPSKPSGPPISALPVPTVPDLLRMQRLEKLQESTEAARKLTQVRPKPAWQQPNASYSLRLDDTDSSKHSNKVRRNQDIEEEMPVEVNLPNIALPITSLPKFDLGPITSSSLSPSVFPSSNGPAPLLTTVTASSHQSFSPGCPMVFTFSPPIVLKDNNTPTKNNVSPFKPNVSVKSNRKNSSISSFDIPKDSSKADNAVLLNGPSSISNVNFSSGSNNQSSAKPSSSFGDKFKPAAGSWECDACMLSNKSESKSCIACETPRSGGTTTSVATIPLKETTTLQSIGFGSQFKPPSDTWSCKVCMINNKNDLKECAACSSKREDISKPPMPVEQPSTGFEGLFKKTEGEWNCGDCYAQNKATENKCACCTAARPNGSKPAMAAMVSAPIIPSGFGDKFKKKADTWDCPVCCVNNSNDATTCMSCEADQPGLEKLKPNSNGPNGVKDEIIKTPPKTQFKFGVEKVDCEASTKPPASSFTFGAAKPYTFGVPMTSASTTTVPVTTSVAAPVVTSAATIKFGADSKPEKATTSSNETKSAMISPYLPSKPGSSSPLKQSPVCLKRHVDETDSNDPFNQVIAFNVNELPSDKRPKQIKPILNSSEDTAKLSPKKGMFSFGAAPSMTVMLPGEAPKENPPSFLFEKPSAKATLAPATSASTFAFSPGSKTAPETTSSSSIFAFGAPSNAPSGGGFGSSTLTAKPAANVPVFAFGRTSTPAKPVESVKTSSSQGFVASVPTVSFGAVASSAASSFGSTASAASTFGTVTSAPVAASFEGGAVKTTAAPLIFGSSLASTTTSTTRPVFGGASVTSGAPPPYNATSASVAPIFGAVSSSPAGGGFGGAVTTASAAPPMFGATSAAANNASGSAIFGATKKVTFNEQDKTPSFGSGLLPNFGASAGSAFGSNAVPPSFGGAQPSAPSGFAFGNKNESAIKKTAAVPSAFSFTAGTNQGPSNSSSGGFPFGSSAGAPVNNNSATNAITFGSSNPSENKFGAFPSQAPPAFPSIKPVESAPFATPSLFGGSAPTPAPSFGSAPQQFGESGNGFNAAPNFSFGNNQAIPKSFGFGAVQNNTTQNPAAAPSFAFGASQQHPNTANPAVPPVFDPSARPTFNFTGGSAPTMFSATPSVQQSQAGPISQRRIIRKAVRRSTQPR